MDSEDKRIVGITGMVVIAIISLFSLIVFWHCYIVKTYTNAGYTRTTLQGSDYTHWVKDTNEPK